MKTIFVAAPFYHWIETDEMKLEKKTQIEKLLISLRNKKYKIYNAHEREQWGDAWLDCNICTPLDYNEIQESDIIIAFPGPPTSGGVHIELGWGSCMQKKILLVLQEDIAYSSLVMGLGEITDVKKIYFKKVNHDLLNDLILTTIEEWL